MREDGRGLFVVTSVLFRHDLHTTIGELTSLYDCGAAQCRQKESTALLSNLLRTNTVAFESAIESHRGLAREIELSQHLSVCRSQHVLDGLRTLGRVPTLNQLDQSRRSRTVRREEAEKAER